MDKQLFQNEPPERRAMLLAENADKREERSYYKSFDDNELTEMRKELANLMIRISDKEAELKGIQEQFKEELKPIKNNFLKTLELLKNQGEIVKEDCFVFFDENLENAGYYNAYGKLVDQRKTEQSERQKTIKMGMRYGTND